MKKFLLFTLAGIFVFASFSLLFFYFSTRDASLDKTLLHAKNSNLTVLDSNGVPLTAKTSNLGSYTLSRDTLNAFIAKEDKRFYSHSGIDPIRMIGALKNNIKAGTIAEGGSTITQQLIKNTHLSSEKTLDRKLDEIKLARLLEKEYSKDEILNIYLNTIYFGSNCFGIAEASAYYFNKTPDNLTLAESAILAGSISAPSVYNPASNLSLAIERGKTVLSLMLEQGLIDETKYTDSMSQIDSTIVSKTDSPNSVYLNFALLEALEILGRDEFNSKDTIEIKTYLNSDAQKSATESVKRNKESAVSPIFLDSIGAGAIVIDNETSGIIAFASDCIYNLYDLRRQPASTIKPILVYGPAIENDLVSPASFILDEPININGYSPLNATKVYYGEMSVREALVRSTNIPAVKLMNSLGVEVCKQFAQGLGITFDELDNSLALALGGMTEGVTLLELASAYKTLANGGKFSQATFIKEISINGLTVYRHQNREKTVMKESTAYLLTDMLKDVATRGTGRNLNLNNIEVASKTGTNYAFDVNLDGWNASYTTRHTAVSWFGNLKAESGDISKACNGSTYPTFILKDVFSNLYSDSKPESFKMPDSVVEVELDADEYYSHNIVRADSLSYSTIKEVFAKSSLPPSLDRKEESDYYYSIKSLIERFGSW